MLTTHQHTSQAKTNMKEPLVAGVYRVCDPVKRVSFIGYTFNVKGIFKRFRFELGLNSCSVKPLQVMYNLADGKVNMELLEEMAVEDVNDTDARRDLEAAMQKWQKNLEENGETVKIILL